MQLEKLLAYAAGKSGPRGPLAYEELTCARQGNTSDCGVYVLMHCTIIASYLAKGASIDDVSFSSVNDAAAKQYRSRLRELIDATSHEYRSSRAS